MKSPARLVVASVLLAVAVLGLVMAASQIGMTYYLPPDDTGFASKHVAVFAPAVVGTVIAALAALSLLVHLVVVVRRAVPRSRWIAAGVITVVAAVVPVAISLADRPTF
ncbi:hypothetical protein ACEXQB_002485 [Herbiconiux sp. P18]|uniref:hypothetical protein n=1 Tax=Herbiconiux liangxiaofengii TaxID=3342795 RepID=UPI0035B8A034